MSIERTPPRLLPRNRSGQALIEYVLIIALASVGLVLVLALFRNQVGNGMEGAKQSIESVSESYYVPGGGTGRGRGGGAGGGRGNGRGGGN